VNAVARAPIASGGDELKALLRTELVEIVANQYGRVLAPVLATQLMILACAFGRVPAPWLAAWALAIGLVHVARVTILRKVLTRADLEAERRVRIVVGMSLVSGMVHASAALFLPYLPLFLQALLYVLLLALCAGCVAVNVGHLPTVLAFLGPITATLALYGVTRLGEGGGLWEMSGLALLTVLFGSSLLFLSRDTYRTFASSVAIRLENAGLARNLARAKEGLERALQGAEAASRAKTRFLASASHDLRQPLHTLSFLAAALEMRPLDEKGRDILRNMTRAVEDLSSEFDMLLDISKLDAGVVPVSPATFEAGDLLARVSQPFHLLAESKGIAFHTDWPDGIFVATDRGLLERILRNLLDNALKYTPAGSIRVTARRDPEGCVISVSDTGIGISEAEQEKVFEEFYQIDNPERDRRKGLGLGLPIVRRLAELLKLGVDLHSAPGRGTTVTVSMPVVPPPPRQQHVARPVATPLGELQLLLIEDEIEAGRAMQGFLENLGCQVSLAATINEATALAHVQEPDVVVADFRLRGAETGLQAIEALRRTRPGLPALLITGDTAPEKLAEMNASRIPLLHKPVQPGVLVEKITSLLSTTTP
jgi:signal transduction histidine kinase